MAEEQLALLIERQLIAKQRREEMIGRWSDCGGELPVGTSCDWQRTWLNAGVSKTGYFWVQKQQLAPGTKQQSELQKRRGDYLLQRVIERGNRDGKRRRRRR